MNNPPPPLSLNVNVRYIVKSCSCELLSIYMYMYVICLRYHMLQKGLNVLHKNVQRNVFYTGSILLYLSRCFVNGLHKVKFVLSIVGQVINLFFFGGVGGGWFVYLFVLDFSWVCVLRHSSNNIRVLFDNSSWKMKATKLFFANFKNYISRGCVDSAGYEDSDRWSTLKTACRIQFDSGCVCMPRNWIHISKREKP